MTTTDDQEKNCQVIAAGEGLPQEEATATTTIDDTTEPSASDAVSPAVTRSKRLREKENDDDDEATADPEAKRARLEEPEAAAAADAAAVTANSPEEKGNEQGVETVPSESDCKATEDEPTQIASSDRTENLQQHQQHDTRKRWRAHQMAEDYIELATNIMLAPLAQPAHYGFEPSDLPLEAVSVLGYLKSPARVPMIIERWSPYEIAVFEGAMAKYGKEFLQVSRAIATKTTKECIAFYYVWKKTRHYEKWKEEYVPPHSLAEDDKMESTTRRQAG